MVRFPVLLATVFFVFLPALAARSMGLVAPTTCPFQYDNRNGEIRVNVTINGKGPFSMKLDTGSTMSLITPEVAKLAGVDAVAKTYPCGAYGASVAMGQGAMGELAIGPISLYGQTCLIGDLNDAIPCDGILGGEIFDKYAVQLDFAKGEMRFYPSGTYRPSAKDACIPINIQGNHVPICYATIDNMPAKLEIDTGFDGSLTLLPDFVRDNHLLDSCRKVSTVTTYSLEGIRSVGVYAMNQLSVGSGRSNRTIDNVLAIFDDFDTTAIEYNYDGLLGTRMLSHWTVTFDYAHSRLVFH